ncbi:hypothetical protein D3C83_75570 [compost metagenome]
MTAFQRLTDGIEVIDVAVNDRFFGQRLNRVAFDPIDAFACLGDFHHFDGRRTDVGADQWRGFGLEQSLQRLQVNIHFSLEHKFVGHKAL